MDNLETNSATRQTSFGSDSTSVGRRSETYRAHRLTPLWPHVPPLHWCPDTE